VHERGADSRGLGGSEAVENLKIETSQGAARGGGLMTIGVSEIFEIERSEGSGSDDAEPLPTVSMIDRGALRFGFLGFGGLLGGGCGRLDLPEIRVGFDPIVGDVAHVRIESEQLMLG